MKIAAIIAEYNPFHNGHLYLIEQIKKEIGADYIIAVMSGDFMQRGLPSIVDKFTRAKASIACGIDAVFELPVFYASSSAERFAKGAVSLLNSLGNVSYLCFGSECGKLSELNLMADLLLHEPQGFKNELQKNLKLGFSYPNSVMKATQLVTKANSEFLPDLLNLPNNTLAIEYLKALKESGSTIIPYTVTRFGTDYNDTRQYVDASTNRSYADASAIRSLLEANTDNFSCVSSLIPKEAYNIFSNSHGKLLPICLNDFSLILSYRLSLESASSLKGYLDVSEDLANRIDNKKTSFLSFTDFLQDIKTKQYTMARLNRALIHIMLGIPSDYLSFAMNSAPYARLLAINEASTELLRHLKITSSIPIITKAADRILTSEAEQLFQLDVFATDLYQKVVAQKFHTSFQNDISHTIEIC